MSVVTTTLNYIAIHETCYNTLVVDIAHSEGLLNYRYLILLVQKITILPFGGIFWFNPQFNKPEIFFLIKVNKFLSNLWLLHARPPRPQQNFQRPCIYDGMDIFRDPTFQTTTVYVLCSRII